MGLPLLGGRAESRSCLSEWRSAFGGKGKKEETDDDWIAGRSDQPQAFTYRPLSAMRTYFVMVSLLGLRDDMAELTSPFLDPPNCALLVLLPVTFFNSPSPLFRSNRSTIDLPTQHAPLPPSRDQRQPGRPRVRRFPSCVSPFERGLGRTAVGRDT